MSRNSYNLFMLYKSLVCNIFFNTSSNQSEVNYFLQIRPNRRPNLSSVVEPGRQHHSSLHPLSVYKLLEQKRSMTSEFLYTVIVPLIITKTKFSNLIGYRQLSELIGRCNRKVHVMRKYNWTEKCSMRHCTRTLECVLKVRQGNR